MGPPKEGPPPRGPLAPRLFMIPDELIEDYLVNDIERVLTEYLQTMVPDTLIAERFGTVDADEAFRKIRDDYAAKRKGVSDGNILKQLHDQEMSDIADLAGVRDRLRHTYNNDLSEEIGRAHV